MVGTNARRPRVVAALLAGVLALAVPAAAASFKPGLCGTASESAGRPVVVFSAFPAELAPLVAAATIESTVTVDGRQYYVGRLEGVRVVLGLTGIGLVNAANRTASAIKHFKPVGIVFSGVAGSTHRIADVTVAAAWEEKSTMLIFPVNPALRQIARRGATALPAPLETCTRVPPTSATAAFVCMPFVPEVAFPDLGESDDPYNGAAPCAPGGGEIGGCELPVPTASLAGTTAAAATPEIQDMETAAVARIATKRRVPFVAMRAVSDGAGDPKGVRPPFQEFFDYYRLAAANAALVTRAFLAEVNRLEHDPASHRLCRLLAHRGWKRAAGLL